MKRINAQLKQQNVAHAVTYRTGKCYYFLTGIHERSLFEALRESNDQIVKSKMSVLCDKWAVS